MNDNTNTPSDALTEDLSPAHREAFASGRSVRTDGGAVVKYFPDGRGGFCLPRALLQGEGLDLSHED